MSRSLGVTRPGNSPIGWNGAFYSISANFSTTSSFAALACRRWVFIAVFKGSASPTAKDDRDGVARREQLPFRDKECLRPRLVKWRVFTRILCTCSQPLHSFTQILQSFEFSCTSKTFEPEVCWILFSLHSFALQFVFQFSSPQILKSLCICKSHTY